MYSYRRCGWYYEFSDSSTVLMRCGINDHKHSKLLKKFYNYCTKYASDEDTLTPLLTEFTFHWRAVNFINDNNLWDKSVEEVILLGRLMKE